ncbi:TPA: hypothetical protein DDW35_11140 [Candidatus Sumerlaeota bacterium]|jgi:hypothetical protein|nr:hypothetical protein [Candidatus Sumerlaeota bacterium]
MQHAITRTPLMVLKQQSRWISLSLLLACVPLMTSCYGYFPVTRAVYDLNGKINIGGSDEMPSKAAKTVAFWVFIFFPVYFFAGIADALVFNLVEFWTDKTLVLSYHAEKDGKSIALESQPGSKDATLTISRNGQVLDQRFFIKVSETRYEVRDAQGTVLGVIVKRADGKFVLQDTQGTTLTSLSGMTL